MEIIYKKWLNIVKNETVCRRVLQLQHFGESFDKTQCNQTCDNCKGSDSTTFVEQDHTESAKEFLSIVCEVGESKFGMGYYENIWRGSKNAKVIQNGHDRLEKVPSYGKGKSLPKQTTQLIMKDLIRQKYLEEKSIQGGQFSFVTINLSRTGQDLLKGKSKFKIRVKGQPINQTKIVAKPKTKDDTFEKLKLSIVTLRKNMAHSRGVLPYTILSEESITELSKFKPKNT